MRKFPLVLAALVLGMCSFAEQTNAVKLAVISETAETSTMADLLTAEFSRIDSVQLLERSEIQKVYHEQVLSASGSDYLKLGRIMGADGVVLLGSWQSGDSVHVSLRLVAVKPGVVLLDDRFEQLPQDPQPWAPETVKRLVPILPKLVLLTKDAIPVSVVNLRSALQSDESREVEDQLTALAIQRLSREKQIFVLERQHMQSLESERDLNVLDESEFWEGGYLLDGTVDNNGYSKDTITISAKLTPPKGGQPLPIEVSGSRSNLVEVINKLSDKILENLKPGQNAKPWNATEEAAQFYAEAQWALEWGVYPKARESADSAWALGKKDIDTAIARIQAYGDNVALGTLPQVFKADTLRSGYLVAFKVPEVEKIKPLTRALEIFHQNASMLLDPTNADSEAAALGVQLLARTSGMLESFYFSAEARLGNEPELKALREGSREVIMDLTRQPLKPPTDGFLMEDPQQALNWLLWEEAGMTSEKPEDTLGLLHRLLESGYHPADLPRVVGWNWEDRKRVRTVLRQFVTETCASTNKSIQMEGMLQALLMTSDEHLEDRKRIENQLCDAMWENRDLLFHDVEMASLVRRTRAAVQKLYDEKPDSQYWNHEPIDSLHHRLHMDLLTRATEKDRAMISELFWLYRQDLENEQQARELLPVALSYQQRVPSDTGIHLIIDDIKREAGMKQPSVAAVAAPAPVTVVAEEPMEARFVSWKFSNMDHKPGRDPYFRGMCLQNGLLWVHMGYASGRGEFIIPNEEGPNSYLGVNATMGVTKEIQFPSDLEQPGELFAVSSNALYVIAGIHLYSYPFSMGKWEEIHVPMEGASQMVYIGNRLFIGMSDGLLEVQPETGQAKLLVSSRRKPAANEIDPLWEPAARLFALSNGFLGVISRNQCLTLHPGDGSWKMRNVPENLLPKAASGGGTWSTTGAGTTWFLNHLSLQHVQHYQRHKVNKGLQRYQHSRHYLLGFRNDDSPMDALMMKNGGVSPKQNPADVEKPVPTRWDWPQAFPLEPSIITLDEKRLWILCPRNAYFGMTPEVPVEFHDTRQATLFCFEPDVRQPVSLPIHFEENDLANLKDRNGKVRDVFDPEAGGFRNNMTRQFEHTASSDPFWMETPEGFVFGGPSYRGHWLIPRKQLESKLKEGRQVLLKQSGQADSSAPNTPKL